jgi:hypothetical protein
VTAHTRTATAQSNAEATLHLINGLLRQADTETLGRAAVRVEVDRQQAALLTLPLIGRDAHLKDGTDDGQQRGAHGGEARQHSVAAEPVCSSSQGVLNGSHGFRAPTRRCGGCRAER